MERFAGRYALLKPLGHGGMGEVFLARDLATRSECALKRLHARAEVEEAEALRREFAVLASVRHPAIVAVHELGFAPDGRAFFTMEYVPGLAADRALERGDWAALAFVASEVTQALAALHAAGVVHGDVKPTNVLVVPSPTPGALPLGARILDFGLASTLGAGGKGHVGTAGFAAPEVVHGEAPSVASDLYGLGATLYALIAGQAPFAAADAQAMLRLQRTAPPSPEPLEDAGAPGGWIQLVTRLLDPDPHVRPRDADEVRAELERLHPAARRSLAERLHARLLVGREQALATIERRLVAGEGPGVLVVVGPAGIGKSALLAECAARAALAGRSAVSLSAAALTGADALATALERVLEGSSHAAPGVVLIDDAERLDGASRQYLRRLALREAHPVPTLVLARRGTAESGDEEERLLLDAGVARVIELAPLDEEAIRRLAAARLGGSVPEGLHAFLWERAGGHPGTTVELLRRAAAQRALIEVGSGCVVDEAALRAMPAAEEFETMLLGRLAGLSHEARGAAEALAVWRRPASPEVIHDLEPAADEAGLGALLAEGLAERHPNGALSLLPPALGTALIERLPAERRAALRRRALARPELTARERFAHWSALGDVVQALAAAEAAHAETPDARVAEAAARLVEASAPDEAAGWHARAGVAWSRVGRYADAIAPFERAVALAPGAPEGAERAELLSTAYLRVGRTEDVLRVVEDALRRDPPAVWRSRLLTNAAAGHQQRGEPERARAVGEEALALASEARDDVGLGAAGHLLAYLALAHGRTEEAEALAARAEEAYARAGHALGRVRSLGIRAALARARRDHDRAGRCYRAALAAAREERNRLALEEVLLNLGVHQSETGQWEAMRDTFAQCLRLALEDGRLRAAALAMVNLAHADGLTGRVRPARREARRAIRMTGEMPRAASSARRALAQAWRGSGRLKEAASESRGALELAMQCGDSYEVDWSRIEHGRALAAAGAWREAGALWDAALAGRASALVPRVILAALAGRAALRAGDAASAGKRLEEARATLADRVLPYAGAVCDLLEAELALARGAVAEGSAAAARALAALRALPAPGEEASARLELARLAMAREGAEPPVIEWLQPAVHAFRTLGDRRSRERALATLVEWLRRHAAPAAPALAREVDLIRGVRTLLDSLADFNDLTQRAMHMAVEQFHAERGVLVLIEPDSGELRVIAEQGGVDASVRREALSFSRGIVRRVAESGGSLLVGDAPSDLSLPSESVMNLGLRSIVCVPMYVHSRIVGAVYLDDSRRAEAFSDDDRSLLEGFAQLMAIAIEKSRGHEELLRANARLVDENLSLRQEAGLRFQSHHLIGTSAVMQRVLAVVERAAVTNSTVLITGENGTGKEMIARTLHRSGKRRRGPFVDVNCGAIPETLIESELFGILANVATGVTARSGKFVQADGGTLFLDEIGEMPLNQQVALLAAISNRQVTPVGGSKPIPVDVRIIAATNQDLRLRIQERAFREDLFYRLNVIPLEVPPLRERKADIPALARHFVAHFAKLQERELPEIAPELLAVLMQSDWPGNVRELQNYIERVMVMNPGVTLHPNPLPRDLEERRAGLRIGRGRRLTEMVEELERRLVREALHRARGNQSLAARELGVPEQSIRYRIRKYGLIPARQNRRSRVNWRS